MSQLASSNHISGAVDHGQRNGLAVGQLVPPNRTICIPPPFAFGTISSRA